jgi:DNA topoisomerase-3
MAPLPKRAARGKKPRKPKFGNPTVNASPGLHLRDVGRNTPLKIPYGNKEVAQKLGARYGADGWYAPPGVDLSAFKENGWL